MKTQKKRLIPPKNGYSPLNNICITAKAHKNLYSQLHSLLHLKSSGVYTVSNFCGVQCSSDRVYCDTTLGGGGWTIIQRRQDGSVDFKNRYWVEYEDGFGSLDGEFWLGLRSMNCLTSRGNWELQIDYELSNGARSYLYYKQFAVGPAEDQYQLSISRFDSVGLTNPFNPDGDRDRWLNGRAFSSHDRDNDRFPDGNCAKYSGGWWYKLCSKILLNDVYNNTT